MQRTFPEVAQAQGEGRCRRGCRLYGLRYRFVTVAMLRRVRPQDRGDLDGSPVRPGDRAVHPVAREYSALEKAMSQATPTALGRRQLDVSERLVLGLRSGCLRGVPLSGLDPAALDVGDDGTGGYPDRTWTLPLEPACLHQPFVDGMADLPVVRVQPFGDLSDREERLIRGCAGGSRG